MGVAHWGVGGNVVSSSVVLSVVLIDKAAMESCSEDMAGHAPCRIFMPVKQFHSNVQRPIQFSTESGLILNILVYIEIL